ncbi:hypothetical protein EHO57_13880 [Leptospira langatensis]|uniref:Large polyvalent protein-associated domain-containing protein n=2 Tax=Leptospira langatensis TaxID=2484983 RepID=A0A5R2ASS4_9LEPT|nr:hypothetical protein EHO57_13880 [Leptospira langatensis]
MADDDPLSVSKKMESSNPGNRGSIRQEMFGTLHTEEEATSAIETEEVDFKPEMKAATVFQYGISVDTTIPDYSKAPIDKIIFFKEKNILKRPRPAYIPEIDIGDFDRALKFRFPAVQVEADSYLVQLNSGRSTSEPAKWAYMSLDGLAATENYYQSYCKANLREKYEQHGIKKRVILSVPRDNKMTTLQFNLIGSKLFGSPPSRNTSPEYKKVWEEYHKLNKALGYKRNDISSRTSDRIEMNTYDKGKETSYGDSGTKADLLESMGVLVKRQNGKPISDLEIQQIKEHLGGVYLAFGDRREMAKNFGLKISHSGNVLMHARRALGIFTPSFKSIGVSFQEEGHPGLTLAHEFGHFMDHYLGKKKGGFFASDRDGSLESEIANVFRDGMEDGIDSAYWTRTCECFARACEMYYSEKIDGEGVWTRPQNPRWSYFKEKVKPLMEKFFEENSELLKTILADAFK